MATQMQLARQGIITEAMLQVAAQEQLAPEVIRAGVAAGTIAVCCNINHKNLVPCGVGQGLAVKVNANIGTSSAYPDPEPELAKLRAAIDAGADSVMDLSTDEQQLLAYYRSASPEDRAKLFEHLRNARYRDRRHANEK